ncbi:MAG TPA: NADPH-dependent F420 reductase [Gemmatimonadaceae bacterium]|nr:NADPH-dependent F420 reductase [Gemmatimonadaceae bacterium]HPV74487.1 NADPH-dependent F420 reductase [Gemmatimonadaceae bacterium]
MRIAVIGSGNVGGTLGRRWATLGHDVVFGVRDPKRGAAAVKGGAGEGALPDRARVATPAQAVRGDDGWRADVVLVATPWPAVASALSELGPGALDGVVLLDATNPLGPGLRLESGPDGASGAEQVQALAPTARVVKAFNTTGFDNMRDPVYEGRASVMFYAGDDAAARQVAHQLATDLGFDAVDAGPLARARALEHLAVLWISLAMGVGGTPSHGRSIAFRLMRR